MFHRSIQTSLALLAMSFLMATPLLAQNFTGVFTAHTEDGQNILDLKQTGNQVSGTYMVGPTRLIFSAPVQGGKAQGQAILEGTPVKFFVSLSVQGNNLAGELTEEGDDGRPDPQTTEKITFIRSGAAPSGGASSPSGTSAAASEPPSPAQMPAHGTTKQPSSSLLDNQALQSIAGKVKSNFKRDSHDSVLAAGNPPLTVESVAAFAELLRLTFEVEMTEAEFDATCRHFIQYYQQGDAQTKTMLAGGWQNILAGLNKAPASEKSKGIEEVRSVLERQFAAGAQTGMPWAVAMNGTIQRRKNTVARIQGNVPEFAKKSDFHQQMTEADLEASLEMLYFMWVSCGRDASLVTPETIAHVRMLIVQNFPTFPAEVQYIFANAQKVYSSLRGQWAQATPAARMQMAQSFATSLDQLGLTVPTSGGGGDTIRADGAWSDMNGKSHGQWAAEMVQGMAGNSYKSSW